MPRVVISLQTKVFQNISRYNVLPVCIWTRKLCYWKDPYNQRSFLEKFRQERKIEHPSDWYSVNRHDIEDSGGKGLLDEHKSLFKALQYNFPDIEWKRSLFRKPRNFWTLLTNQRALFDQIKKKYNINSPEDWSKVTHRQVIDEGGKSVLNQYSSLFSALHTIYPEYDWNIKTARSRVPNNYWKDIKKQRLFLDELAILFASKFKLVSFPDDWCHISYNQIVAEGGKSILKQYSSLFSALQTIYPEHDWNSTTTTHSLKESLIDHTNQRKFLDSFAVKYNIKEPSEWSEISAKQIIQEGGALLLNQYPSLRSALETIYPEHKWNSISKSSSTKNRVSKNFWKNPQNQRLFFDQLANKFDVKEISDWSNVSTKQVVNEGGKSILNQYSSLFFALKAIYPEYTWDPMVTRNRVPKHYWNNIDNQRNFFDELAAKFNIQCPGDWKNVTTTQIIEEGGKHLLSQYNSLSSALQAIYPENNWCEVLRPSRVSNNHWEDINKVKEFIYKLKDTLQIKQDEDWFRVSRDQVKTSGGSSLILKYKSLRGILQIVYPEKEWDKERFKNRWKRSAQRWLCIQVQKLFPNCEVIEEYLHEELSRVSSKSIELDVYIPSMKLAFEYQGEHHYVDSPALGCGFIELHQNRDSEKAALCKQHDITLVVVPYWWDNTLESLQKLISSSQ